ncbi:MAG: hypothetical protein RMJ89_09050 [Flammeovirgaceae bacterium]|nr:hypothetical protein [Flammeovirgaceae bacterium]
MPSNWKELLILKHIYDEASFEESEELFYWMEQEEKLGDKFFDWIQLQHELDLAELSPSEKSVQKILQESQMTNATPQQVLL